MTAASPPFSTVQTTEVASVQPCKATSLFFSALLYEAPAAPGSPSICHQISCMIKNTPGERNKTKKLPLLKYENDFAISKPLPHNKK